MIEYVCETDEEFIISAENQEWDENTLKELHDSYNIFFMSLGAGIVPVMRRDDFVILGIEDDGNIIFEKEDNVFKLCFNRYWIDFLIADLEREKNDE